MKTTYYGINLTRKDLLDYLSTRGFDLGICKTRSFTKLYNKRRYRINYNGKKEKIGLEFDLTTPKKELKPGVFVDELTMYLCDLVEHEKTMNIAQFDKWNRRAYKNPYELHN